MHLQTILVVGGHSELRLRLGKLTSWKGSTAPCWDILVNLPAELLRAVQEEKTRRSGGKLVSIGPPSCTGFIWTWTWEKSGKVLQTTHYVSFPGGFLVSFLASFSWLCFSDFSCFYPGYAFSLSQKWKGHFFFFPNEIFNLSHKGWWADYSGWDCWQPSAALRPAKNAQHGHLLLPGRILSLIVKIVTIAKNAQHGHLLLPGRIESVLLWCSRMPCCVF